MTFQKEEIVKQHSPEETRNRQRLGRNQDTTNDLRPNQRTAEKQRQEKLQKDRYFFQVT